MIAARPRPDAMPTWAAARDEEAPSLEVTATYDPFFLAVAVAVAVGGEGLPVVPHILVRDHLRAGMLLLAFGANYVAYINDQSEHVEQAKGFCHWLKRSIRQNIIANNTLDHASG